MDNDSKLHAKKIKAVILIDLENPYQTEAQTKFIKTEIARILKEFIAIEDSRYGGRDQVETYTDKLGNKLVSIVAFDRGAEIPYLTSFDEDLH